MVFTKNHFLFCVEKDPSHISLALLPSSSKYAKFSNSLSMVLSTASGCFSMVLLVVMAMQVYYLPVALTLTWMMA
jgi:hypothetical protein